MNIFEQAVRQQARFNINGSISIEQLYAANPNSKNNNGVTFKTLVEKYEEDLLVEQESLGKPTRRRAQKTDRAKQVELQLAVISGYLDELDAKAKEEALEFKRKEKRQELLQALHLAEQKERASKTVKELRAELEALDK